ncbi:hypothetical protein ACFFLM_19280 [Deinococcus oregonensis]|uniref:Uncharacterized protein n=1 Tax=Deinococcus oregonensis TaxID=1805970 RepID=A0ABV6B321_9DEIO
MKAQLRAFLNLLFVPTPPEPDLWGQWCYWYDFAPGSLQEREAWRVYMLDSVERVA